MPANNKFPILIKIRLGECHKRSSNLNRFNHTGRMPVNNKFPVLNKIRLGECHKKKLKSE